MSSFEISFPPSYLHQSEMASRSMYGHLLDTKDQNANGLIGEHKRLGWPLWVLICFDLGQGLLRWSSRCFTRSWFRHHLLVSDLHGNLLHIGMLIIVTRTVRTSMTTGRPPWLATATATLQLTPDIYESHMPTTTGRTLDPELHLSALVLDTSTTHITRSKLSPKTYAHKTQLTYW